MGTFTGSANVDYRLSFADKTNMSISKHIYICAAVSNGKRKMEATVCSLGKGKFVDCPFVYEETTGSYPFANG